MKRLLMLVVILFAGTAFAQVQEDTRTAMLERAYAEVLAAEAALKATQAKRDQGEEPQGGERSGTVTGFSRLNENYFQRQQALEQEVAAARKRYDDAIKRWNELK